MQKCKVKICCISSIEEAKIAIQGGADAIGLVGNMPSGPGVISDELIAEISNFAQGKIATFLLTSETTAEGIIRHYNKAKTSTIQLVDSVNTDIYEVLKARLPHVELVQVIHVLNEESMQEAQTIAPYVDTILLDSGNPNLTVKQLGGTGRTHNWTISKQIVDAVNIPVFLAGGLNSSNVQKAIHQVQPYGVDLCSGVRTDGKLYQVKLNQFMTQVK